MLIRVLIAVASDELRARLLGLLESEDVVARTTSSPGGFWDRLGQEAADLVIAEPAAIPQPIAHSLSTLRNLPEGTELVAMVATEDPEQRSRLLAAGALAVVYQGLPSGMLRSTLANLVARRGEALAQTLRADLERDRHRLSDFSSASPVMQEVLALARRVAASDSSLLILGETGVGKEWLVRSIHEASRRSYQPFVPVNCAAVPDTLLESELFGHERGAFTGAHRARRGYFEVAHRGTLFLDEICEMPSGLQAKLLRVLQERRVQRLGAEESFEVDVRIMAATHRDPETAIEEGRLREDLYFRLAVVTLTVPPLRERREDIVPLFESYVDGFRVKLGRWEVAGTSPEALAALSRYRWPSNVRELINVAERVVLLCRGEEIGLLDLPRAISGQKLRGEPRVLEGLVSRERLAMPLDQARQEIVSAFEREYLARLLESTGGSVGRTAELAGIDPRTLYNKMKAHGLRKEDYRSRRDNPPIPSGSRARIS